MSEKENRFPSNYIGKSDTLLRTWHHGLMDYYHGCYLKNKVSRAQTSSTDLPIKNNKVLYGLDLPAKPLEYHSNMRQSPVTQIDLIWVSAPRVVYEHDCGLYLIHNVTPLTSHFTPATWSWARQSSALPNCICAHKSTSFTSSGLQPKVIWVIVFHSGPSLTIQCILFCIILTQIQASEQQ